MDFVNSDWIARSARRHRRVQRRAPNPAPPAGPGRHCDRPDHPGIQVGKRQGDDSLALASGNAQQSEEVLGHVIGGLGIIPVRVVVEELAEAEGRARDDGHHQFGIADGEPPGTDALLDVAERPGGETPVRIRHAQSAVEEHLAQVGVAPVEAAEEPEALSEDLRRVVEAGGQLVEEAPCPGPPPFRPARRLPLRHSLRPLAGEQPRLRPVAPASAGRRDHRPRRLPGLLPGRRSRTDDRAVRRPRRQAGPRGPRPPLPRQRRHQDHRRDRQPFTRRAQGPPPWTPPSPSRWSTPPSPLATSPPVETAKPHPDQDIGDASWCCSRTPRIPR